MTIEKRDRDALIKYKIERAEETIEDAVIMFNSERLNSAVNRIYYACFYSAEAILLTKGLTYSDHGMVIGTFNKEFVKNGILNKEYFKIIHGAFNQRQTSDYGEFIKFNKEDIALSLEQAKEFIKEVNKLTLNIINKEAKK